MTDGRGDDATAMWLDEGEVAERAGAIAAALERAGCRSGDRVALVCGNEPAFVAARDAATACGLVLAPINPALTAPEIAHVVSDSGARVVMAEERLSDVARRGIDDVAGRTKIKLIDIDDVPAAEPLPRPEAIGATLIYTSGTTGRPKGCLRSEAAERARADELIDTYRLSAGDVHLVACPLAHSAPGIFLRACRSVGAKTVLMLRFRPHAFLDAANRFDATVFFLVPTQYQRLLALADERGVRAPQSVRAAIVAGAPIAPATVRRLVDWLGPGRLWQFYGSSETGTIARLPPVEQLGRPGSVGRPPPGVEVEILARDRRALPPGEVGEIFVRSPALMRGYLRGDAGEPVRPNERGGFISVGDLGCFDEDGYLYLHGRIDDTILSGGINVYPAEVERALAEHPEVAGQVVFGLPDADWGQIVCAAVALAPGARADAAALRAFLRERLAPYKLPKAIAFVDAADLPLGASGKPLRRRAGEIFAQSPTLVRVDLGR